MSSCSCKGALYITKNVSMYTKTYVHMHTYMCTYVLVCPSMARLWPEFNVQAENKTESFKANWKHFIHWNFWLIFRPICSYKKVKNSQSKAEFSRIIEYDDFSIITVMFFLFPQEGTPSFKKPTTVSSLSGDVETKHSIVLVVERTNTFFKIFSGSLFRCHLRICLT